MKDTLEDWLDSIKNLPLKQKYCNPNGCFCTGECRKDIKLGKCKECGLNPPDGKNGLCVGCQAYRDHTGHF